jgi:predicted DNA-binding protein with PD1-like motif
MSTIPVRRTITRRLEEDTDLFDGIRKIARENSVKNGRVTGVGTVKRASLASHDQKLMRSFTMHIPGPMEIVSLYGTITPGDGQPVVQVHLVLSDEHGNGSGGQLLPGGTPVSACDVAIEEYDLTQQSASAQPAS